MSKCAALAALAPGFAVAFIAAGPPRCAPVPVQCPDYCVLSMCGVDDCGACGSGCEIDEACVDGGCERDLPVDLASLWCGHWSETGEFLSAQDRGPAVSVSGAVVTIHWRAAVFEECRRPDAFRLRRLPGRLDFDLIDATCVESFGENTCYCLDTDFVTNARTEVAVAPGWYTITVSCSVSGYLDECGEPRSFEIHVE